MFTYQIICPFCAKVIHSLPEGVSLNEQIVAGLYLDVETKALRVEAFQIGWRLESSEGLAPLSGILKNGVRGGEILLELPVGVDAEIDASCPICNKLGLQKKMSGFC